MVISSCMFFSDLSLSQKCHCSTRGNIPTFWETFNKVTHRHELTTHVAPGGYPGGTLGEKCGAYLGRYFGWADMIVTNENWNSWKHFLLILTVARGHRVVAPKTIKGNKQPTKRVHLKRLFRWIGWIGLFCNVATFPGGVVQMRSGLRKWSTGLSLSITGPWFCGSLEVGSLA